MYLSHALFLRSDRILPVKQIRDRAARISQRSEPGLAVQFGKLFFYLHCLGIKAAVSVKCISVIDPENTVIDRARDILRIDRQYQRSIHICVQCIFQSFRSISERVCIGSLQSQLSSANRSSKRCRRRIFLVKGTVLIDLTRLID